MGFLPIIVIVAIVVIIMVVRKNGGNEDRAWDLYESHQYEECISEYTKLIDRGERRHLDKRGDCYLFLGKYNEAINDYNNYFSLGEFDALCLFRRGASYFQINEFGKALNDFNTVIDTKMPNSDKWIKGDAYYHKCLIYFIKLKNYDDAIQTCSNFIKKLKQYSYYDEGHNYLLKIYSMRGDCYQNIGQLEKAINDFNIVLELDNRNSYAYYLRGETFLELGKYELGLNDLKNSIKYEKNVSYRELAQNLIDILENSKNEFEIKEKLRIILNLDNKPSFIEKTSREKIPEAVRHAVWRRDEGRCVECGSNENLEYDHIIPFSKGGSSTERNIQLLCESCNRKKGANI